MERGAQWMLSKQLHNFEYMFFCFVFLLSSYCDSASSVECLLLGLMPGPKDACGERDRLIALGTLRLAESSQHNAPAQSC